MCPRSAPQDQPAPTPLTLQGVKDSTHAAKQFKQTFAWQCYCHAFFMLLSVTYIRTALTLYRLADQDTPWTMVLTLDL